MDQSCSDSDISLSPSQLLERLQMLRQLQLLQRGKLQKQRLEYHETSETYASSSSLTEMISHFTNSQNSTSYNTFRSLLLSPSNGDTPRLNTSIICQKVKDRDLIDGVSVLNLSQESEFIENSPTSMNRAPSKNETVPESPLNNEAITDTANTSAMNKESNKQILLDNMPILSPKKDFEALLIEKLQTQMNEKVLSPQKTTNFNTKKPFLKRGEGMTRFGLKKNDLVIQNTKSLPWRRKNFINKSVQSPVKLIKAAQINNQSKDKIDVEILVNNQNLILKKTEPKPQEKMKVLQDHSKKEANNNNIGQTESETLVINFKNNVPDKIIQMPKGTHPMLETRGKTWAAILSKEQSDFLSKLKQSDYYKNFASPTKSTFSDMSCDENTPELRNQKETAEQNLFDLLENKVSHESFNLENSFFNQFLRKSNLESSGESTPFVLQKCLANNPNLMHIFPDVNDRHKNSFHIAESAYTECCSDTCSSVSSCCSCKTIEPQTCNKQTKNFAKDTKEVPTETKNVSNNQNVETEAMKANMAEMNEKLITTSELLKERLQELEDEIETFRKENVNLNKLREEVDMERQKFYEEKNNFEQKFNEEKILSEYYLAEEKEKLNKQKQMYERYVREMRGRLNKKEKDEVVNLKQEISNLKEEIRVKDAKSTSTIARLRNQIKIIEKEKSNLQNELDKAKKENRRLQHSNDITRRMTNMKYLEQINKKLTNMTKETRSEVDLSNDTKYKAFEIERQSRNRQVQPVNKDTVRRRAKSVPNLKVTSRYAKYFSQKDAFSELGKNNTVNVENIDLNWDSENSDANSEDKETAKEINSENENENNLEKIYLETFRYTSPKTNLEDADDANGFFLRKSNSLSSRDSKSLGISVSENSFNRSKSPISVVSHRSFRRSSEFTNASDSNRVKSPVSILNHRTTNNRSQDLSNPIRSISPSVFSNHSSLRSTVIPNDTYRDKLLSVSPEPTSSKTSLTKTSLNPTEIRKPDGSRELRYPNGNVKYIAADGKYTKFVYYNGDVKENFLNEGRIKYYYAETKTYHTTHPDGLEVLEFPDGQVEKRYKDGSSEVCLPNGSIRYFDPKNEHVREEWRFPDGAALTISASGEQRITFSNGQVEVHATDHKRREFPDGTVKVVYNDGTSETRYASGRVRIKDKHGNLIMDSATG